ncbi:uncharacterized protein LOC110278504 [Arachis duranensis]|uniref:Uncharacterized protein LOC110278504 n=1 Tax=Arachis duranensis TaxID=130453 RepID=A0A6P5N7E3_ARADU|nr:uncharacterized protein LOC110278504 [Arachis duranensis]
MLTALPWYNYISNLKRASLADYGKQDGLLLYREKLWVPDYNGLRELLLHEFHKSVRGVIKYVPARPRRLLQLLPVPKQPWVVISLNFIVQLPKSAGYTVILVVVDRFTKVGHFTALKPGFTVTNATKAFINYVVKLHGILVTMVSDRDSIFLSKFWKTLFKFSGTKLNYNTAYHPQSDGQTEKHFYGPFQVTQKIAKAAYRLALPAGCALHLIFHVAVLKQFHEEPPVEPVTVINLPSSLQPRIVAILDNHSMVSDEGVRTQVLVDWEGTYRDETM